MGLELQATKVGWVKLSLTYSQTLKKVNNKPHLSHLLIKIQIVLLLNNKYIA